MSLFIQIVVAVIAVLPLTSQAALSAKCIADMKDKYESCIGREVAAKKSVVSIATSQASDSCQFAAADDREACLRRSQSPVSLTLDDDAQAVKRCKAESGIDRIESCREPVARVDHYVRDQEAKGEIPDDKPLAIKAHARERIHADQPEALTGGARRGGVGATPTPPRRPKGIDDSKESGSPGGGADSRASKPSSGAGTAAARGAHNEDPGTAQAEAGADLAAARTAQQSAQRCCGDPLSCASPSDRQLIRDLNSAPRSDDQGGLTAYCSRLQGASDAGGSLNGRLGARCTSDHYACISTVSGLISKYEGLMSACGGECSGYGVYQNAYSQLQGMKGECDRWKSHGDQMVMQALNSAVPSGTSEYCRNRTASMSPSSMGPGGFGGSGSPQQAGLGDEFQSQNSAAAVSDLAVREQGQAGFIQQDTNANQRGSFNLLDLAGGAMNATGFDSEESAGGAGALPAKVNSVPANGGNFAGGAGSGPSGARLDSKGRPSAGGSSGSSVTDIEQGFYSGGYSQPVSNASSAGRGGNYPQTAGGRRRASDEDSRWIGLDLKRYLPNGAKDPRRLAGGRLRAGINGREADIWRRISNKLEEKCRMGLLYRCRD